MQQFHLESITVGDSAVLRISGELDTYTAQQLRERVIQFLQDGVLHLIADLRGVEFLDSTGLGALVGSLKRLRTRDGSFKLVVSTDRILHIFQVTGLLQIFTVSQSVLDAITADQDWQTSLQAEGMSAEEWCAKNGLQ